MKNYLIEEKKTGRQHVVTEEAWGKMVNEFGTAPRYRVLDRDYKAATMTAAVPAEVSAEIGRRKKAGAEPEPEAPETNQ